MNSSPGNRSTAELDDEYPEIELDADTGSGLVFVVILAIALSGAIVGFLAGLAVGLVL